jgi:NitT/TauT family transport system ATP-binding protein
MSMRVSIARALVTQPKVLLMDEPFSALDENRRFELSQEILKIKKEKNLTVIYVTHSIYESVYLSDRIYVMQSHPGRIFEELDFSGIDKNEDYRFTPEFYEQAKVVSDSLKRAQLV